ncbi:site-specific integrase [Planctomycetaceae bacterium]|nr:site-specific integrase [Planctomycetaceae bacterium]
MATLSTDNYGNRRIQFYDPDGKRRSVSFGKMPKKSAEHVRTRIDDLETSAISGHSHSRETAAWLDGLGQVMKGKLAKVGLIEPPDASTLKTFLDSYIASRTDIKQSTLDLIQRASDSLVSFLGDSKRLRDITEGDADQWRLSLMRGGLSDNTARRMCGRAKQFFRSAMRSRLIDQNPFIDLETAVQANAERFSFVSPETIEAVIEAAPCAEWRLLIALARYGGLRTPSEPVKLRWSDIDWEKQRIRVPSPKTEHHAGKASRVIPIFPELKPYLDEAYHQADEGAEFVITRYRSAQKNLRTHFIRIIEKAGIEPWGKPWQNLRASRETELAAKFPLHVVTAWMGNSQPTAMKHYLHVLDSDFEQAISETPPRCADTVQQPPIGTRNAKQPKTTAHEKTPDLQGFAMACEDSQSGLVARQGLEP